MRLCKLALVLGVAALLASPALAQRGRGRGFAPSVAQLVQNASVKKELKIDSDQATKVKEAVDKVNEDNKDEIAKLRDQNATPEERAEARKKVSEATDKALKGVLKDDQLTRLHQIRYFVIGFGVFQDPAATEKLKLTDKQKDELKDMTADFRKDMQGLFPQQGQKPTAEERAEMQKKMQTMNKDYMAKATKVLDDSQKKTLDGLVGKPFDYKPEFGGRRGGKPRTDL